MLAINKYIWPLINCSHFKIDRNIWKHNDLNPFKGHYQCLDSYIIRQVIKGLFYRNLIHFVARVVDIVEHTDLIQLMSNMCTFIVDPKSRTWSCLYARVSKSAKDHMLYVEPLRVAIRNINPAWLLDVMLIHVRVVSIDELFAHQIYKHILLYSPKNHPHHIMHIFAVQFQWIECETHILTVYLAARARSELTPLHNCHASWRRVIRTYTIDRHSYPPPLHSEHPPTIPHQIKCI